MPHPKHILIGVLMVLIAAATLAQAAASAHVDVQTSKGLQRPIIALHVTNAGNGHPGVVGDCSHSQVRPPTIVLECGTLAISLTHLHWQSFGAASARATGSYREIACTPYCHANESHSYPITLVLSHAAPCGAGHDDYRRARWSFTADRPDGAETQATLSCPLAG